MRVIHIIPAAFNYFDDIKQAAFTLMEDERELGIEAEAFTLQYGTVTRRDEAEQEAVAPSSHFTGLQSVSAGFASFDSFDVVHVHCPFFGAAGKLLAWKKANPAQPLIVTFYHPAATPDFFSFIIKLYTIHYMPKIIGLADVIATPDQKLFERQFGKRFTRTNDRFIVVDGWSTSFFGEDLTPGTGAVQLSPGQILAAKYNLVYTSLYSDAV